MNCADESRRENQVSDVWRLILTCLVVIAALGVGGVATGVVGAADEAPGEPASFFGTALDEDGEALPAGTTVVAVVNNETAAEITVDPAGEYGGAGAFDDKLRVDSAAGDEVTFRFADSDGPSAGSVDLKPGVFEENLTFPGATVEYIRPDAVVNAEPDTVVPDGEITLDGSDSTAYGDTKIETYRWSIQRDDEAVASVDGAVVSERVEANGTYDVELTVIDENGRTNETHSTFEVDPTLETESSADEGDEIDDDGSVETTGGRSTSPTGGSEATGDSGAGGGESTTGGGTAAGGGTTGSGGGSTSGGGDDGSDSNSESIPELSPGTETSGGFEIPDDPIADERADIDDAAPNASGTTVALDDPTVREIVLRNGSANGELSVWEFDSIADGSPPLPNDLRIASASLITVPVAHRDDPAIIRAIVDHEWLTVNDLQPDELTVYRLPSSTDEWQPLPTATTDVDDGILVEAETPGFSQFVIAGSVAPERAVESSTETETPTRGAVGETSENANRGTNERTRETSDDGGFVPDRSMLDRPTAALLALLAVTGLVGWIFIPRRRR